MNIDQFISKLETSDAYRNNGEVRKLVDQSRQVLIDLAHGNDGDAFKAELMKFNDRLDECLNPGGAEARRTELVRKIGLREQYSERLKVLKHFHFLTKKLGTRTGDAPTPSFYEVAKTFSLEMLELADTFQEPTLLLVPETYFYAKTRAVDVYTTIKNQGRISVDEIYNEAKLFSESDPDFRKTAGWRACLVEGAHDMKVKEDDNANLSLGERLENRKASLRPNEKGMDRNTYIMLMMGAMKKGEPLDQDTHTLLEDDPARSVDKIPEVYWDYDYNFVNFGWDDPSEVREKARFRSSVGGDVLLSAAESAEAESETYTVEVDYGLPLDEAIAAGKYDTVDNTITAENFPSDKKSKETFGITLFDFKKGMTTDEVLAEFDKLGLRPATLPELLALGAAHPELQREFLIMALGSIWQGADGSNNVSILGGGGNKRNLGLTWFKRDDIWESRLHFAAVRK